MLSLILHPDFSLSTPINGQIFKDMDSISVNWAILWVRHAICRIIAMVSYLHNYVGMLGIPLEPYPYYPKDAKTIFLTESAAMDTDISIR